jgi:hypothetical protein
VSKAKKTHLSWVGYSYNKDKEPRFKVGEDKEVQRVAARFRFKLRGGAQSDQVSHTSVLVSNKGASALPSILI